jgi:hypothetical protein
MGGDGSVRPVSGDVMILSDDDLAIGQRFG